MIVFGGIFVSFPAAGAEVTVYEGDSIVIEDGNWTLTWGQNYTFNRTGSAMYSDTYYMNMTDSPDRNISVTSDTATQINTTLWEYNFDNPSLGDLLIKLEVEADPSSTVDITFTGLPTIDEKLVVDVDGSTIKETATGGMISWSYSDWSTKNFTVTYEKKETKDEKDDTASSGPIPVTEELCSSNKGITDSHSWSIASTDQFKFNNIGEEIRIQRIDVQTVEALNSFEICVTQLNEEPNITILPENTYRYFEISTDNNDEIDTATVTFLVNQSFAQQYNSITLSRYNEGWDNLPTTLTNSTGNVWTYDATTPGFSYFAVHGETEDEEESGVNETEPNFETEIIDTNAPVEPGETLLIDTNITNTGDKAGEQNVTLELENIDTVTISLSLNPGESAIETFQIETTEESTGSYTVHLSTQDTADATDIEITDPEPSTEHETAETTPLPIAIAALTALLIIGIGGFYGYQYYNKKTLKAEINRLSTELHEKKKKGETQNFQQILELLDSAEQAAHLGEYKKAQEQVRKAEEFM